MSERQQVGGQYSSPSTMAKIVQQVASGNKEDKNKSSSAEAQRDELNGVRPTQVELQVIKK